MGNRFNFIRRSAKTDMHSLIPAIGCITASSVAGTLVLPGIAVPSFMASFGRRFVGKLFMPGLVGVLIAVVFSVYDQADAIQNKIPRQSRYLLEVLQATGQYSGYWDFRSSSWWEFMQGQVMPTEAAAVAVAYAMQERPLPVHLFKDVGLKRHIRAHGCQCDIRIRGSFGPGYRLRPRCPRKSSWY